MAEQNINQINRKIKIEKKFDKATLSYDQVALVQKICANKLVNMLISFLSSLDSIDISIYQNCNNQNIITQISTILDLGAGTGYISEILYPIFPHACYTLNDISANMLAIAYNNLQKIKALSQFKMKNRDEDIDHPITLIHDDMERYEFSSYDIIISNFAIQWLENIDTFISKIYKNSKILCFSILLYNTFAEYRDLCNTLNIPYPAPHYRSLEEMHKLIQTLDKQYIFENQQFTIEFSSVLSFLRYLKLLGANTNYGDAMTITNLRRFAEFNSKKHFFITYDVLFCITKQN